MIKGVAALLICIWIVALAFLLRNIISQGFKQINNQIKKAEQNDEL